MYKLKFNDTEFNIIDDGFSYSKSSRELTFSNIVIDFDGYTMADLPIKLQEVQVMNDTEVVFFGYIDTFELPEFDTEETVVRLELSLLSPLSMASRKVITINGLYDTENALNEIIAPLLAEGFTLKEMNVSDSVITLNIISQTVEYALNKIANSKKLFYYIDELKQITINDIDYQFGKEAVLNITESNFTDIENIRSLKPTIKSVDYGNIINAKNILLYGESIVDVGTPYYEKNAPFDLPLTLKPNIVQNFKYKIDISDLAGELNYTPSKGSYIYQLWIIGPASTGYIRHDGVNQYINNIKFDNDDDTVIADFTLIRDPFFKYLVTGVKYTGATNNILNFCASDTALIPATARFINSQEIDLNKGIINSTGIIEKIVDLNNTWYTESQLIEYIKSVLSINSNQTDEIELNFKGENLTKYEIGDNIIFDLESKFSKGSFIVTDLTFTKENLTTEEMTLNLKNSNILENFIDFFRTEIKQENKDQLEKEYIIEYMDSDSLRTAVVTEVFGT